MATLAEIRAKLQQQENRGQGGGTAQRDNAIYAHWNIPENSTAKLRFLPDADTNNDFFWVERNMIRLPFNGIKGQMDSKPMNIQVPCVEMWGDSCPILAEVRTWFKDPGLEDMGRKYWKKRSYLFQGFVRENPMSDDETPENPIRRFIISPQIFNVIKAALLDTEIEELPTDFDQGLDFWVTKTTKGGYADYSTSKWGRKENSLTDEERAAIDTHGFHNLSEFLPKRPGETELKVIQEMFEASVDGQPYDPDRWGAYYKPSGMQIQTPPNSNGESNSDSAPTSQPAAENKPETSEVPERNEQRESSSGIQSPAEDKGSDKTADILAMIRSRQSQ